MGVGVNRTLWQLTGMGRWQGTVSQIIIIIFCLVVCLRKRYYYYLTNGIRKDMIAPEEDKVMVRISKLISNRLLTNPFLEPLMINLVEEKDNDYYNSLMKSIGEAGHKWGRGFLLWRAPSFLLLSVLHSGSSETSFNFQFKCSPPSLWSTPALPTL